MKYAVDKIEENIVTLESLDTKEKKEVPLEVLPSNIKEGTILTVARIMSESAMKYCHKYSDITEFIEAVLKDGHAILLQTKEMLPGLTDEREKPCIFFFSAVHFQENMLGYAVLQHDLTEKQKAGVV